MPTSVAPPSSHEIRAYILEFLAELGDLAKAYGQPELARDLQTVAADHHALASVEGHV